MNEKCGAMCIATDGTYIADCDQPEGHVGPHIVGDDLIIWDDGDTITYA